MRKSLRMLAVCGLAVCTSQAGADELADELKTVLAIGREGAGNLAARSALQELSERSPQDIPAILKAFTGASPVSANYLRNAVEVIADRAIRQKAALPAQDIEAAIADRSGDPRARRLAYEVLVRVDAGARERIIPDMLQDPSPEFRRDAVQRLMGLAADAGDDKARAVSLYREALLGATDSDQVQDIAKALRQRDEKVDLIEHYGFLTQWKIIGPFDNRELIGFDAVYPPEERIELDATLKGQLGDVTWGEVTTDEEFGIIDVAKAISPYKGAVMYLTTTFDAVEDRAVEFRFGTPNAWKVWVNGELLFGRDEYHRGMAIDQYTVDARLKAGPNVILLKLCQNEQTQDWAQRYQIQFRVCDASGLAVHPKGGNKQAAVDASQPTLTTQISGSR